MMQTWIAKNYPSAQSAALACDTATAKMVAAFPELRRVRGHAMVGVDFRPHWWCETPDGEVVDPTAHQWKRPPHIYEEWTGSEDPHGKCINCGELLFRSHGSGSWLCWGCDGTTPPGMEMTP